MEPITCGVTCPSECLTTKVYGPSCAQRVAHQGIRRQQAETADRPVQAEPLCHQPIQVPRLVRPVEAADSDVDDPGPQRRRVEPGISAPSGWWTGEGRCGGADADAVGEDLRTGPAAGQADADGTATGSSAPSAARDRFVFTGTHSSPERTRTGRATARQPVQAVTVAPVSTRAAAQARKVPPAG
jgi:hypothetical protein